MSLAENLKGARIKANISQAELARKSGVSQPMIAQIETGMKIPGLVVGVRLSKALDITVEQLLDSA